MRKIQNKKTYSVYQKDQYQPQNLYLIPSNDNAIEEMIFQNIKNSYICAMSGKKTTKLKSNQIIQKSKIISTHKPRIDFQNYKGARIQSTISDQIQWSQGFQNLKVIAFLNSQNKPAEQNSRCFSCRQISTIKDAQGRLIRDNIFQLLLPVKQQTNKTLLFYLNTLMCSVIAKYVQKASNQIQLIVNNGQYRVVLQAVSNKAAKWWFKVFQKLSTIPRTQKFQRIIKQPQFYRRRRQTNKLFQQNCKNGDIILFQDAHFFAKAQRLFTFSQFDHVGMIVRDDHHGILIYESNSGSGVTLTPWRCVQLYQWYKTIPRLTWRPLNVQRGNNFSNLLQTSILKNLRKQFHISISKIMSNNSTIYATNINQLQQPVKKQQKGFFCSQLIASTYKDLGLLTRDDNDPNYCSSTQFIPKSFSQKANLKLMKGQLLQEIDITFPDYQQQ